MKIEDYKFLGTVTGRFTSETPNCFEVEKSDRPKYLPESKPLFIEADLSKIGSDTLSISYTKL